MNSYFQVGDEVCTVKNLPGGREPDRYSNNIRTEKLPIGSVGAVWYTSDRNIEVRFGECMYGFHPQEIDHRSPMATLEKRLAVMDTERHPLFDIAERTPLFIVEGQVYAMYNESTDRRPRYGKLVVVEPIGTLVSFDEMYTDRTMDKVQHAAHEFGEGWQNRLLTKPRVNANNLSLIVQEVFPHLRADAYNRKLTQLIAEKQSKRDKLEGAVESSVNQYAERVANEARMQAERIVNSIRSDALSQFPPDDLASKLHRLLQTDIFNRESVKQGTEQDLALIDGEVYSIIEGKRNRTVKIVVDRETYSIGMKISSVEQLERAHTLKLDANIEAAYIDQQLSHKNLLQRIQASNLYLGPSNAQEIGEDGFGYIRYNNTDYVYIDVPAFIIKTRGGSYYAFRESKLATSVDSNFGHLCSGNLRLADPNGHPYLDGRNHRFADICIGNNNMPSSAKTDGALIAAKLCRGRDILMYGHAGGRSDMDEYMGNYTPSSNRISERQAQKMGIPIIAEGR